MSKAVPDAQRIAPKVVLIGPPGAGKSTVAAALGELTGLPVRDTDEDVVAAAGRSITDIFNFDGEAAFREYERTAVAAALAEHGGILALGGGAVMNVDTQVDLAGGPVVFLSISMPVGVARTGMGSQRPMFVGVNPRSMFRELLAARLPVYQQLAQVTINTDNMPVAEVAAQIMQELAL